MRNIKIIVSYDGSYYHGWQRQANANSVQEELEKACSELFNQPIVIKGSGRTDTGVHALGQCASFMVDTQIPVNKMPLALNRILPKSIVITHAEDVDKDFHPQYCAKSKTYKYQILNQKYPIPQMRNYAYFVYMPLDVEKMKEAAKYFLGTHDFIGFCSAKNTKADTRRTITDIDVTKADNIISIKVCGDGFLYNMVRIIVGTLVDVGVGKIEPSDIEKIIQSKDRKKAGDTAPACGLTLYEIEY